MASVKLSPEGGYLVFSSFDGERLLVEAGNGSFSGKVVAPMFMCGSPAGLFRDMAASWRGWQGEMTWSDIEGRCELTATHDGVGHVDIVVALMDYELPPNLLRLRLRFEPGQLEAIAREMMRALPDDAVRHEQ